MHVAVKGKDLTVREVVAVAREGGATVSLSSEARFRIAEASGFVESLLERDRPVYGVTTGLESLQMWLYPPRRRGIAAQPPSFACKRSR